MPTEKEITAEFERRCQAAWEKYSKISITSEADVIEADKAWLRYVREYDKALLEYGRALREAQNAKK